MRMTLVIVTLSVAILAAALAGAADAASPRTACYVMSGGGDSASYPASTVWLTVEGTEKHGGRSCVWWRLTMRGPHGGMYGIRALSERAPMTSALGAGRILRYIFKPSDASALEYVDESTGEALLPAEYDFRGGFLPVPSKHARYPDGLATTGTLLGHVLSRAASPSPAPSLDFASAQQIRVRTDFIVGTSRTFKDDGQPRKQRTDNYNYIPWTKADYEAMLEAGFNYFAVSDPALRPWLLQQTAYIYTYPMFPEDFYRSNVLTAPMFIDEPMVIMGWNGGIPGGPSAPEDVANALRDRVQAHYTLSKRLLSPAGASIGTLDLVTPRPPSWDTEFTSAWYQLQAGAPALVHEGRYVARGYGWEPDDLVGKGVDGLSRTDMFNYFYAFLRGAARSFGGDWGTSVYGQSDRDLRVPAFIRAYDMGAKYLWFWTSDHDHHMPFDEQLRIAKAITQHARTKPRPDRASVIRQARVGIAVPSGYSQSWYGTWGMRREQLNPKGVSYGDISAAAFWEGVIQSRRGVDYDFLVDHPGIGSLGYEQLYIVQTDGSVKCIPPRAETRAPTGLSLTAARTTDTISPRQAQARPGFQARRASAISVDADLSDWSAADWVTLGEEDWFGDPVLTDASVQVPADALIESGTFFGARHTGLTDELMKRYHHEEYLLTESFVVVTDVEAGSPAESAGIRQGDLIVSANGRKVPFSMTLDQIAQQMRKKGGQAALVLKRGARSSYGGAQDLAARAAIAIDDDFLYFAAEVTDDTHVQTQPGFELWRHDSIQIGIDPVLDRETTNYGENSHEIGFALKDGRAVAWRWYGRRGQPLGIVKDARVAIRRDEGRTIYEAAVPLSEFAPLSPDIWPRAGLNIVVNDSDGEDVRKGRLELIPGAMTRGKYPARFAAFQMEPSGNPRKVSAALFWETRTMPEGGAAELLLGIRSPETRQATVRAELTSLDSPDAPPSVSESRVPVSGQTAVFKIRAASKSPAGRYRLKVSVKSESGQLAAIDELPVFIYPR